MTDQATAFKSGDLKPLTWTRAFKSGDLVIRNPKFYTNGEWDWKCKIIGVPKDQPFRVRGFGYKGFDIETLSGTRFGNGGWSHTRFLLLEEFEKDISLDKFK